MTCRCAYRVAILTAAVLGAGCPPSTAATACQDDDDCPVHYVCSIGQYCVEVDAAGVDRVAADGAAPDRRAPDASATDRSGADARRDSGAAAECGTTQVFNDDYADDRYDDMWSWTQCPASLVTATNSHLEIQFASPSTSGCFAAFSSSAPTDLRGSTLRIEVSDPVEHISNGLVFLSFETSEGNRVGFRQNVSQLWAEHRVGAVNHDTLLGSYDRTADRWWQLREQGGRIYFETSGDGTVWTWRHDVATPAFAAAALIYLMAGASGAWTASDLVVFDNLNAGLDVVPWCR